MRNSYYLQCTALILWNNFSPLLKLPQLSFAYLGLKTPQADLQIQSSQVLCPVEIPQKKQSMSKGAAVNTGKRCWQAQQLGQLFKDGIFGSL